MIPPRAVTEGILLKCAEAGLDEEQALRVLVRSGYGELVEKAAAGQMKPEPVVEKTAAVRLQELQQKLAECPKGNSKPSKKSYPAKTAGVDDAFIAGFKSRLEKLGFKHQAASQAAVGGNQQATGGTVAGS